VSGGHFGEGHDSSGHGGGKEEGVGVGAKHDHGDELCYLTKRG